MTLIIGIGNKAQNGKDSAGEAVVDYYDQKNALQYKHSLPPSGPTVKLHKFAAALYDIARKEYGMTVKDAPLLQRIGQERRQENLNYWVDKMFASIQPTTDIAVITDVRYLNEAAAIKAKGGYLVNVTRLNPDGTQYITNDRPADHPSETELDGYNWDFHLINSHGHRALLAQQAITLVEYLRALHS